jgi:cobyrinic acid a,c-diamide synthase
VHAAELAANDGLRSEIRSAIELGMPTVAECAGLLYLCDAGLLGRSPWSGDHALKRP